MAVDTLGILRRLKRFGAVGVAGFVTDTAILSTLVHTHPKRKTIGLRVPDNAIAQSLLDALGEPMMSVTLILPGDDLPLLDPYEIRSILQQQVDLVIDGGYCGMEATSVIDLSDETPVILRQGAGSTAEFEV